MRILIAEDDEALGRFVRQGLENEHYTVDLFKDGDQAQSAAAGSEYDLVILDLNLPKLDGVSILRHLRLKKPSLPVLILTQRTRVEDRVECLDTGADDYLAKPFSFTELSARIRALIRRSHNFSYFGCRPSASRTATANSFAEIRARIDIVRRLSAETQKPTSTQRSLRSCSRALSSVIGFVLRIFAPPGAAYRLPPFPRTRTRREMREIGMPSL